MDKINILVVGRTRVDLDARVDGIRTVPSVNLIKRILREDRDVDMLAGLEFAMVIGMEAVEVRFHPYLLTKVRRAVG